MENIRPPPPTAVKLPPQKKVKKVLSKKKQVSQSPQQKTASPILKKQKSLNPKEKLRELYDNLENYGQKKADIEIKVAEQKQLEVLREMLIKGFTLKNLETLQKTLLGDSVDKKDVSGKVNEGGDGPKITSSNKTTAAGKVKSNPKTGGAAVKKAKPVKKSTVKKN